MKPGSTEHKIYLHSTHFSSLAVILFVKQIFCRFTPTYLLIKVEREETSYLDWSRPTCLT